jgi:serine protease Do
MEQESKQDNSKDQKSPLGPFFESKKQPSEKTDNNRKAVLLVAVCLVAGFIGGYYGGDQNNQNSGTNQQASRQVINSESELITQIAKDVGESVVSVNVTAEGTRQGFFGNTQNFTQESAGTGVVVDAEKGIIITNRHVIPAGASSVSVVLSDGTELTDVEVVGRTNENDTLDIAFLKIKDEKGKTLKSAKLGDSSKMQVGDKVVAIGNALGQFQNTVTTGIISGYGRDIQAGDETGSESLQNLFQTDASINQGNSGGPLVNVQGEVIGINTAVAGGSAENIGFAIPINDIQGLIKSVIKDGKLLRPYLGVRYVTLNDDYAYQYNLQTKRGAYIAPSTRGQSSILSGSPAEKAGLKEKDIITKVNDQAIDEKNSLISVLGRFGVGEKVSLTIIRDGQEQKVEVTLEAAPQS